MAHFVYANGTAAGGGVIASALQIGASVSTSWALAGLAIAAILLMVVLRPRAQLRYPLIALAAVCLLPIAIDRIAPLFAQPSHAIALRVTVLGPDGSPQPESRVHSSIGGEPKRVDTGWEFTIPAERRGARITLFAEGPGGIEKGRRDLVLGPEPDQSASLTLSHPRGATVRGIVVDDRGGALGGARVWLAGYGGEAVLTDATGSFELPAHAAPGEGVELQAEANGRRPWAQQAQADDQGLRIMLPRL